MARGERLLDVDKQSDMDDAEKVTVGEDEASVTNTTVASKSCSAGAPRGISRCDSDSASEDGLAADTSTKREKTSKTIVLLTQKKLAYRMAQ